MSQNGFHSIIVVVLGVIAVIAIAGGLYECNKRGREQYELRRIHVEKCKLTPEESEKTYPYNNNL